MPVETFRCVHVTTHRCAEYQNGLKSTPFFGITAIGGGDYDAAVESRTMLAWPDEQQRRSEPVDITDMSFRFILAVTFLISAILPAAAQSAPSPTIKFEPNMTVGSLAGRAETDIVEFSSGRRVTVGQIRRLDAAAVKLRAPKVDRAPAALKMRPAATGTPIRNAADLGAALKRPDTETVQLPSGRLATVGQIKLVQPTVERRLGDRKLESLTRRPSLSGPAVSVSRGTTEKEWIGILNKPDDTVLVTENGKRATVGEIKEEGKRRLAAGKPGKGGTKPSASRSGTGQRLPAGGRTK
jgi:hypothetical protein